MKYFLPLLITAFISCNTNSPVKQKKNSAGDPGNAIAGCDYENRKLRCKSLYLKYKKTRAITDNKKLQKYFADSLLTCWHGTPWDYNGTALSPGDGKIACGYFITTTLQHAGITINRVRMAQCPSSELIRSVCAGIKIYSNKPIDDLINAVKKEGAGLYIAGLDFHTGFIYYDGQEVFFIHSSFYGSKCVVKEKAAVCAVLKNSKYRMTGKINFL